MSLDWANGLPLMTGPYQLGLIEPSPETAGYWDGLKEERLCIKQCGECGKHHHPRRLFCTACNSDLMNWVDTKGNGKIYSFSTVHRAPTADFEKDVPYTVGLLHLDEDVYFFARISGSAGKEIRIGAPVRLVFREVGTSGRLPCFDVVG
jgi:uncharacterized OB-fold protein